MSRIRPNSLLFAISILILSGIVGCSQLGIGDPELDTAPTPTPLPTPIVAEKPEYNVEIGSVVNLLEFTGRVSPMVEQELFFRSDGFVDSVFVARGDTVQAGDIIAQLDISELDAKLENAEVQLETAETKLTEAEATNIQDIAEAELAVEESEIAVRSAQQALNNAATTNRDDIAEAQLNVQDAQVAMQTANYNVGDATTTRGDDLQNAQAELERAQINLRSAEFKLNDANTTQSDDIETARAELRNAQLSLQIAETDAGTAWNENQDTLREAVLALQNSQLDLQKEQQKPRPASLTQAEVDLQNAQQRVAEAERQYAESLEKEWLTEDQIKADKDELDAAREELRVANATYQEELNNNGQRQQEIIRLQNQIALDQLAVEKAQRGIDPATNLKIEQAQVDVQLKQQALEKLERGVDPTLAYDVQTARLDVRLKEQELAKIQRGIDPNLSREATKAQFQVQLQQLKLATVQRGVDRQLALDLEKAQLELRRSELSLAKLERGIDPLLALDVKSAELEIEDINRQIAEASLIAPFDGTLLRLDIKAGDQATGFTAVVVLAEPGLLEISADLTAEQLNNMSVNQPATIAMRNRPEDLLSGYVRQLPAGYSGSTVDNDDDSEVRIAFGGGPPIDGSDSNVVVLDLPDLEVGELSTVKIVLEEKLNVVWVPPAAIRRFQGRDFVVVRNEDGTQQRVDIRIGIQSDDRVEVEAGLEPGQVLIGE